MSKLDVGVGDEFPLDEDNSEDGHRHGRRHHRHGHFHGHHHMRHHGHHHRRHFHGLPLLLILGGIAALVYVGKLSAATAAYGAISVGVLLLAIMVFFGVRHFRRFHQNPQGQA